MAMVGSMALIARSSLCVDSLLNHFLVTIKMMISMIVPSSVLMMQIERALFP